MAGKVINRKSEHLNKFVLSGQNRKPKTVTNRPGKDLIFYFIAYQLIKRL